MTGINALTGLIFLAVFGLLHLLSHFSHWRLPFLAVSESVWEHLKMAFWAFPMAYAGVWVLRPGANVIAIFSGSVFTVAVLFALYYVMITVLGTSIHAHKALYVAVIIPLTFLAGWIGAESCVFQERAPVGFGGSVAIAITWALMLFLFTVFTYVKPGIALFTLERPEP